MLTMLTVYDNSYYAITGEKQVSSPSGQL